MVDQCCGMANEGCCMAGQQCYTYYENVCENVNEARCQPNIKQICVDVVLPDCRIVKERRQQVGLSSRLKSLSCSNGLSRAVRAPGGLQTHQQDPVLRVAEDGL